jgi:hypothetical protein
MISPLTDSFFLFNYTRRVGAKQLRKLGEFKISDTKLVLDRVGSA